MAFQKVTVFGGSGFLGRYIVQGLAQEGAVVRVGVRRTADAHILQPLGNVGQIVGIQADVRDPASLVHAAEGSDAVINLVGILYESGKATFGAIHAQGAANVAQAAKDVGARRLVHVSAIGANARSPSDYARSKAAGETAVLDIFPDATILRPSVIFGPEDGFFNRFAGMSQFSPVLPVFGCPLPRLVAEDGAMRLDIYGDGGTKFQPVYVGDVANAAVRALHRPEAKGATYELGGPSVYSFKELMDLMASVTGRRRILAPLPFWYGAMLAFFLEMIPGAPILTRDQVKLLRHDNVVGKKAQGFAALGITPTAAEVVLPTYLDRYRRGGRFRSHHA